MIKPTEQLPCPLTQTVKVLRLENGPENLSDATHTHTHTEHTSPENYTMSSFCWTTGQASICLCLAFYKVGISDVDEAAGEDEAFCGDLMSFVLTCSFLTVMFNTSFISPLQACMNHVSLSFSQSENFHSGGSCILSHCHERVDSRTTAGHVFRCRIVGPKDLMVKIKGQGGLTEPPL